MTLSIQTSRAATRWACGLLVLLAAASTGCTVDTGGQTLPSPYWLTDDVQYYRPGPEFILSREAAEMRAYAAAQGGLGPSPIAPAPSPAVVPPAAEPPVGP